MNISQLICSSIVLLMCSAQTTDPTTNPTIIPSLSPSRPTKTPTISPSRPTKIPTCAPSKQPSFQPSVRPTRVPTYVPSKKPTFQPSVRPTKSPVTSKPTLMPVDVVPTASYYYYSSEPSIKPTATVTHVPSIVFTNIPSISSASPTVVPSLTSTYASSFSPSSPPTAIPIFMVTSSAPTCIPSTEPSVSPSILTTCIPSNIQSVVPSAPTNSPSLQPTTPTSVPSITPSAPSLTPVSAEPSILSSAVPSSFTPSITPSTLPTHILSSIPSCLPSTVSSILPSTSPSSTSTAIMNVQQDVYNSTAEVLSSLSGEQVFKYAVSKSLSSLNTSDVIIISIININFILHKHQLNTRRKIALAEFSSTAETATQVDYQVVVTYTGDKSTIALQSASAQLTNAIISGNFTKYLHLGAVLYSVSDLTNAYSNTAPVISFISSTTESPTCLPTVVSTSDVNNNSNARLSWNLVGGIIAVGILCVAIIAFLIFYYCQHRNRNKVSIENTSILPS